MKPAIVFLPLLISALLVPSMSHAQQPRARHSRERRAEPRTADSTQTFQVLGFTIMTGDDDLRTDSDVRAHLTFQDDPSYDCFLHGASAAGAAANITWDNHSTHDAPPCRLRKPMSLADLKQVRISLQMESSIVGASNDNWNINRIVVDAYNPGSADKACVFNVSGNPLARLTGDQPEVTISDFPSACR